jgi:hypothetical protein
MARCRVVMRPVRSRWASCVNHLQSRSRGRERLESKGEFQSETLRFADCNIAIIKPENPTASAPYGVAGRSLVQYGMGWNRLVKRLVGAAIVLIALALAPSIAAAHPGHAHHGGPAVAAADADAKPAKASVPAQVNKVQEARMAPAVPTGTGSSGPCLNGCCSGMLCNACAAIDLADGEAYCAHPRATGFIITDVIARPGREPEGPIRPPRSFA